MSREAVAANDRRSAAGGIAALLSVLVVLSLVLYGCGRAQEEDLFQQAEKTFGDGDYRGAIALYTAFLKEYPHSRRAPECLYRTAYIYNRHLHDVKRAMDAYSMLFYLYPKSRHAMLAREERAEIFSSSGDQRKAIEEYTWLLQNGIRQREDAYRFKIAMEYMKMNDFGQARIELEELLKKKPSTALAPKAYFQIATAHYLEGDLASAIKAYDRVLERFHPVAVEAGLGKAAALEESGRHSEALKLLNDIGKDYSNSDVIKIRTGSVRERMKKEPGLGGK